MTTSHPAFAKVYAATLPPAPDPTTTALDATASRPRGLGRTGRAREALEQHLHVEGFELGGADGRRRVGRHHLCRRPPAGLGVARELDVLPADLVAVAAVLGSAVHALGRVLEDERREPHSDVGAGDHQVLLGTAEGGEV